MSAVVRTVRLLDRRPGESAEEKTVAGIAIERGVPLPSPRGHNTPTIQALLALEVGESFTSVAFSKSAIYCKAVKTTRRKFTVRQGEHSWRVWRIA